MSPALGLVGAASLSHAMSLQAWQASRRYIPAPYVPACNVLHFNRQILIIGLAVVMVACRSIKVMPFEGRYPAKLGMHCRVLRVSLAVQCHLQMNVHESRATAPLVHAATLDLAASDPSHRMALKAASTMCAHAVCL